MKLKAEITIIDILVHVLIWLLLSVITCGIAIFFFPYSFSRFIINRTYLVDVHGIERKMDCNIDLLGNLGHVLLWFFITIVTLGFGYVFYFYRVWNYALNNTTLR